MRPFEIFKKSFSNNSYSCRYITMHVLRIFSISYILIVSFSPYASSEAKSDGAKDGYCGSSTNKSSHPWIVGIFDKKTDLRCAGTIVSSYHVLTAINCFPEHLITFADKNLKIDDLKEFRVIAGIRSLHDVGTGQSRNITKYYTAENRLFDSVTVVVLEVEKFVFADDISPVCLDWYNDYELDFTDGNEAIMPSWATRNGKKIPCENHVQYWPGRACVENVPGYNMFVGSSTFCAIPTDEVSTCGKILGAGLFFKSTRSRYYLRGITDDFYPNIENTTHIFYTKLTTYQEWLWSIITKPPSAAPYLPSSKEISEEIKPTGCTLPDHIDHGRFKMITGTTYKVGTWVQSKTEILLECANTRDNSIVCSNGDWVPAIGKLRCQKLDCGIGRLGGVELPSAPIDIFQHDYPWVVGIYRSEKLVCSGTLIGMSYVLSAAEHFTNSTGQLVHYTADLTVTAGTPFTDSRVHELEFQIRGVSSISVPQVYTKKSSLPFYDYNIALLKVNATFVPTLRIQPVCVDWDNLYEDVDLVSGSQGVGTVWEDNWKSPFEIYATKNVLKKLQVEFIPKEICATKLMECSNKTPLEGKALCVGPVPGDSDICDKCVAGSGAGVYFKSTDGRYYIRGVAGPVDGCRMQHYALYTNVSFYLPWIHHLRAQL